jgi:sialate O-acetylesterase
VASRSRIPIELAPLVQDGMVLQRDSRVTITGHARPSWPVVVSGTWGDVATTRSDAAGAWRAQLRTPDAGGPYRVVVWAGDTKVVHDVWIGETWLCSGQSNMAMSVREATPTEAVPPPGAPIHLFAVGLAIASEPQTGCAGQWLPATPERIGDFSALCWHFGRELHDALGVPIGLISAAASGVDIEGWTSDAALRSIPEMESRIEERNRTQTGVSIEGGWRPGLFFNAMIAPLAPYGMRGVVWYQGEANVPRAAQYAQIFPVMIADWRKWFGQDLAFGFVQLPGYERERPLGAIAELRDAQRKTLAVPGTGMVVSIDTSDATNIHGSDKHVVGRRLATWALGTLYGRTDVEPSGPLYRGMQVLPTGIELSFDFTDGGLVGTTPLTGFEIAGEDRVFRAAFATIEGDVVLVRSPQVPRPVAVRYGWENAPAASLRNRAGLPAAPFRTDDWPGITDGAEPKKWPGG